MNQERSTASGVACDVKLGRPNWEMTPSTSPAQQASQLSNLGLESKVTMRILKHV